MADFLVAVSNDHSADLTKGLRATLRRLTLRGCKDADLRRFDGDFERCLRSGLVGKRAGQKAHGADQTTSARGRR